MIQLILLILAAICFAAAFFGKTLDGHSLIAGGLFCWACSAIFAAGTLYFYDRRPDTRP